MVDNYNVETLEAVQHYIVKENKFFSCSSQMGDIKMEDDNITIFFFKNNDEGLKFWIFPIYELMGVALVYFTIFFTTCLVAEKTYEKR